MERGGERDVRQEFKDKFVKGFLDWLLLSIVSRSPAYGYEIMQSIKRDFNIRLSPGTVYPILYNLESEGYVVGEWDSPQKKSRKVYRVTPRGWRYYRDGRECLGILFNRIVRKEALAPLAMT